MNQLVHMNVEDGIAFITIDNPPVNVLNAQVMTELDILLDEIEYNPNIKVAIITGAGKAFIAGADIKSMQELDFKKGEEMALNGQKIFNKLEESTKIIIAGINGVALGGGLELAMACDIRICSDKAKVGQPEINLGIIPGYGGTQRLSRLAGRAVAKELIITGDMITATEAKELNIVNKVIPDAEFMNFIKNLAKKIASKAQVAVRAAKTAIDKGYQMSLRDGLAFEAKCFGEVCNTEDKNEGVKAFIEKRTPQFKDK